MSLLAAVPTPEPAPERVPVHVAIIMDGNRRWARARGLPTAAGHRQGAQAVRRAVEGCARRGIRYLTLFAFSSENWRRPQAEIGELMRLLRFYLEREVDALDENRVRLRVIGERSRIDPDIVRLIEQAEARTRHHERMDLVIALDYGGRQEILRAVRTIARMARERLVEPEEIDEKIFSRALYAADIPDPDLLIRTSGEQRISNFLLWQLAYTELVFLPIGWPDFDEQHLDAAIAEYARRERRYGARPG
ncbi:MAG: polyprenyl diphosphate synthase [Geminicoccaceae bacterium]|nr:polyprenyl diphosphate synthase [Geminicoccaceae bacterium]MCS7268317.1 polyprenyl diphosphate synthase [Geminicoccaceae bacterium]MCX7629203.1 polyprenyl diphosphate synthase [Geminicoccaceae bacterium]MDW8124632.1 polyprenyl diphosphate synthase [Geminicoccaceae bacterium]MDW8341318.1 polyprenyl diphosphate synthase [Geminicoccaceae bacterium]